MKYLILLLLSLWISFPASAQEKADDVIFKAMQDEITRSREQLFLPGMPAPFYISYVAAPMETFRINAVLGGITDSYVEQKGMSGIELMLGNYQRTSNSDYSNQLMMSSQFPIIPDYTAIRRDFWLGTDGMYKWAQQNASAKESTLATYPPDPKEAALPEFQKVAPVRNIQEPKVAYTIDRQALENLVKEVSAVFSDYPEIFNSFVTVAGLNRSIYRVTTDSVVLKQPMSFATLIVQGAVMTAEGVTINDAFTHIVDRPDALPTVEAAKKQAVEFAESLLKLKNAPVMEGYYTGPVLFDGWPSFQAISSNLLHRGGLFAFRKPVASRSLPPSLGEQMGQRILDPRLTVKNYSSLNTYNGTPLLGAYEIDAEGVVPAPEITLIEKGVLKALLNGCYPSQYAPQSTGSSRFSLNENDLSYGTAPGTIHIQASKGLKPEQMKKALLKEAKAKGLEYAYIVRKVAGPASCIYRVNVKDGEETLVRFADVSSIRLNQLKEVGAISSEEKVANYLLNNQVLSSVIYPSSILMNDIQINKQQVNNQKTPPLKNPLQR